MKMLVLVCRLLLGVIFTVFGLNGFLHFIPMPPPSGLAGQYFAAVSASHYIVAIFFFQLVCGILLLVNQFVPLALTVLAGVITNIVLFHITMAPEGLPLALITLLLWIVVFASVRQQFAGIFAQKAAV
jgi:putative oxidoreductase